MKLNPYVCFEGRCEEAMEFYKKALDAEVLFCMRGGEAPEGACGAAEHKDKIMHACLKIGDAEVMMSDGMNTGKAEFQGITLSVTTDNDEQARKRFSALSEGGNVAMDLSSTFFASSFGICSDKFGVNWMVLTPVPAQV